MNDALAPCKGCSERNRLDISRISRIGAYNEGLPRTRSTRPPTPIDPHSTQGNRTEIYAQAVVRLQRP